MTGPAPRPLGRRFFSRATLDLARALLGQMLCRRAGEAILRGRIVEVEAYTDDPASHARGARRTPRNAVMFGPAGHAYVYFTYGMHFCFNIVAERDGRPGAVLVRGLEGPAAANGPARLCRALQLDRAQDGVDLTLGDAVWIERGGRRRTDVVVQATRIGIRVATELPWRFYLAGSPGVSRRDRAAEAALLARR
ncbi:MAG: DNA-3-methyladenine glycosylase [Candidatus Binatia bacterium]